MIKYNTQYEILTSNGFSDFDGIRLKESSNGVELKLSNGNTFKCTSSHLLKTGDVFVMAKDSIGVDIGGVYVKEVVDINTSLDYYDILETENHDYISSGLISHNCEFEGSLATLVHSDYLQSMKDSYMMNPVNVLDEKKLRIFSWPIPKKVLDEYNYEYLITVDPAMGTKQDYTVAIVWLIKSNTDIEQVAVYQSNDVPPHAFVSKILALCKMYHQPYIIVETMETAGGIIIGSLVNENDYYNVINMQKEGIGFRMSHDVKIKACTLLQVYCEKSILKIRDELTYGEIEMFGKRGNTYKAIGDNHDDLVMATLGMLNYVNSPYFYGNMDEISIYRKRSKLITNGAETSDDPQIKEALSRMLEEDEVKGGGAYASGAFIIQGNSKTVFEDATRWKEESHMSNQRGNPMFNPHANGNSMWHYNSGY